MQDGTVLCLPVNTYSTGTYYSDAGCTQRLQVQVVPNAPAAGCSLPPLPTFSVLTETTTTPPCSVTHTVRSLGAPYVGAVYSRPLFSLCTAITGSTAYTLNVVPMDGFSAATVVTDP
jgi:hypothetical protein